MTNEQMIEFIKTERDKLKVSKEVLKRYDVEDRVIIITEERGYDILADTLIHALRKMVD